jgi:hypothetical protein
MKFAIEISVKNLTIKEFCELKLPVLSMLSCIQILVVLDGLEYWITYTNDRVEITPKDHSYGISDVMELLVCYPKNHVEEKIGETGSDGSECYWTKRNSLKRMKRFMKYLYSKKFSDVKILQLEIGHISERGIKRLSLPVERVYEEVSIHYVERSYFQNFLHILEELDYLPPFMEGWLEDPSYITLDVDKD